ncbi:hypothetical protein FRC17_002773 [Serendipita sp. 399]|nr:hypothetical protein FRC17_002773 [Serendipita sp. 399]
MDSQHILYLQTGLVLAASYAVYWCLKPKPIGNIPHNRLTWLLGDLPAIIKSVDSGVGLGHWLTEQAFIHGPVMTIHTGPSFPQVIVSDPATVLEILSKRGDELGFSEHSRTIFGTTVPYGMIGIPANEMWHSHRRALSPCVNTQYLKTCSPRIYEVCKKFVALWEAKQQLLPPGSCFNCTEDVQLLTMDNIASFCFGEAFGGVSRAHAALSSISISKDYNANTKVLKFPSPDVPLHNAVRVLFNGQDTTSSALQWGLKLLSHNPDVQRKLRSHIQERGLSGLDDITFEDVRAENVPYLEAVVWEILRLAQVGLFAGRMATRDTQILGYHIPKGTELVLCTGHVGIHDTPERFLAKGKESPSSNQSRWKEDEKAFVPERWLDEKGRFQPNNTVIPFGAGNRMCFGYRFALLQMKLVLVALQQQFYFEPPPSPELDLWHVKETIIRMPVYNYITIRSWSSVEDQETA